MSSDVGNEDSLRRFVFERYPFRGQLVHLGPAWQAMMEHHDYPASVRDALGEAVAATALLSSTLKYKGLLSLQLRGEGPHDHRHICLATFHEDRAWRFSNEMPVDRDDVVVLPTGQLV